MTTPIPPSASEEDLILALVKAYKNAATEDERANTFIMLAKFVHTSVLPKKIGMIDVCRKAMSKMGYGSLKTDPRYSQLLELAPGDLV
jgi:hypothetical protein